MAFIPKYIPNDDDINLDEEPLEDICVVIPEIEEILDERKFLFFFAISSFSLCFVRIKYWNNHK